MSPIQHRKHYRMLVLKLSQNVTGKCRRDRRNATFTQNALGRFLKRCFRLPCAYRQLCLYVAVLTVLAVKFEFTVHNVVVCDDNGSLYLSLKPKFKTLV